MIAVSPTLPRHTGAGERTALALKNRAARGSPVRKRNSPAACAMQAAGEFSCSRSGNHPGIPSPGQGTERFYSIPTTIWGIRLSMESRLFHTMTLAVYRPLSGMVSVPDRYSAALGASFRSVATQSTIRICSS